MAVVVVVVVGRCAVVDGWMDGWMTGVWCGGVRLVWFVFVFVFVF